MTMDISPPDTTSEDALVPEDTTLFGSINTQLHAELHERIESALKSGISSMPVMQEERAVKLLHQHLLPKYCRALDVAEVHLRRNVFTVAMYPPKRRARLVQAVLSNSEIPSVLQTRQQRQQSPNTTVGNAANSVDTDIPAAKQMQELQQESEQLRERLRQAHVARANAQRALVQAEAATQLLAKHANHDMTGSSNSDNSKNTQQLVQTAQQLMQTQDRGADLVQQLERLKQNRSVAEQEDAERVEPVSAAFEPTNTLPKTVFEQFAMDRQQGIGTHRQLASLRQRLQNQQ